MYEMVQIHFLNVIMLIYLIKHVLVVPFSSLVRYLSQLLLM